LGQCFFVVANFLLLCRIKSKCKGIKDYQNANGEIEGGKYLSSDVFYCLPRLNIVSKKAKKAEGLEKHKLLQREKDQKRKDKKQVSLPAKHSGKGKK
jgi:hypothetical protein